MSHHVIIHRLYTTRPLACVSKSINFRAPQCKPHEHPVQFMYLSLLSPLRTDRRTDEWTAMEGTLGVTRLRTCRVEGRCLFNLMGLKLSPIQFFSDTWERKAEEGEKGIWRGVRPCLSIAPFCPQSQTRAHGRPRTVRCVLAIQSMDFRHVGTPVPKKLENKFELRLDVCG